MNLSFKNFLGDKERSLVLHALTGIVKTDWTPLRIYGDWLMDNGDAFGDFIHLTCTRIQKRKDGVQIDGEPGWKEEIGNWMKLRERVEESVVKNIKNWSYVGTGANDEWNCLTKKRANIGVHNLAFYTVGKNYRDAKPLSWSQVPTELLKAGLALHLGRNYVHDTPHHPLLRGSRSVSRHLDHQK